MGFAVINLLTKRPKGRSGLRAQGAFDHTGWDTHTSYAKYSGNEPVECVCRVGELTIRQESARAGVRRGRASLD